MNVRRGMSIVPAPQADLFAQQTRADQIFRRFVEFHQANPAIYALVEKYALEAARAGRLRLGISMIFERIRWYVSVETVGDDVKVNNDFRAYYARMFLAKHQSLAKFFSVRRRTSAEKLAYDTDISVVPGAAAGDEADLYERLRAL